MRLLGPFIMHQIFSLLKHTVTLFTYGFIIDRSVVTFLQEPLILLWLSCHLVVLIEKWPLLQANLCLVPHKFVFAAFRIILFSYFTGTFFSGNIINSCYTFLQLCWHSLYCLGTGNSTSPVYKAKTKNILQKIKHCLSRLINKLTSVGWHSWRY